ncbi:hypothetical protein BDP27DRAFT_741932 [Rhodocollybia butyracea]|uniref:Uncharacterized protein n=1 Tax=Rhodocollybia butyracea TaxID=206335 RepID=A0A9P5P2C3_9AGAR|nr:hypothetical protein BDP27DRAFT_741932 [Rhodocollybia butyracea]
MVNHPNIRLHALHMSIGALCFSKITHRPHTVSTNSDHERITAKATVLGIIVAKGLVYNRIRSLSFWYATLCPLNSFRSAFYIHLVHFLFSSTSFSSLFMFHTVPVFFHLLIIFSKF